MKKVVAVLTVIAMLVSSSVSIFAASFTDVTGDNANAEAVETLTSLGLLKGYDDGTFKPDGTITRAEFAAVITRTLGLVTSENQGVDTIFNDVKKEHWASWNIKTAADLNIIKGVGDGNFMPDDPVTYEQAVKMIVAALGYEPWANQRGGYPDGYLAVAREENIIKKISATVGQPATRGLVAQLVFNSLDVAMLEKQGTIGSESYKVNDDKTFLTEGLKMTKVKNGVVTGNTYTKLRSATSSIKEDEVEIDDQAFKVGNTKAGDYLGYRVTYYYKQDSTTGDNVLMLIIPQAGKNVTLSISAEDIDDCNGNRLEYKVDSTKDDTEAVAIESDSPVIYNGKYYDGGDDIDDLITSMESGSVKLLDSDGNGSYDVIFINAYENYVVDNYPSTTDYKIIDKYTGESVILDPKGKDIDSIIFKKAGTVVAFTTIKKGDILSVAASKNATGKKDMTVLISDTTISGIVQEVSSDGKVTINGKEYIIASNYLFAVSNKGQTNITMDTSGTYYLDVEGKIAAVQLAAARGTSYAYLIDFGTSGTTTSPTTKFKIFNPSSGTIETKNGASKIKIDGENIDEPDQVELKIIQAAKLTNTDIGSSESYAQLIRYATNSNGDIDLIDTMVMGSSETKDNLKQDFNKGSEELTYDYDNRKFYKDSDTVIIDDSTQIIKIPTDRSDTDGYGTKTRSYFKDEKTYKVEAFDATTTSIARMVLVYGDDDDLEITQDNNIAVVKSSVRGGTSDGDPVFILDYYESGTQKSVNILKSSAAGKKVEDLRPGDLIRFSQNTKGRMQDLQILLKADSLEKAPDGDPVKDGKFEAVFSVVYSAENDNANISVCSIDSYESYLAKAKRNEAKFENLQNYTLNSAASYLIDLNASQDNNRVSVLGSVAQLTLEKGSVKQEAASFVVLQVYEGNVRAIFLIKPKT